MRGNDAIGSGKQRIVGRRRCFIQYIETGAGDRPALQRGGQGLVIDKWAAARIDNDGRRLHCRQSLGVHQAIGLRGKWTMQTNNITPPEKIV